jgi:hypothetical protein
MLPASQLPRAGATDAEDRAMSDETTTADEPDESTDESAEETEPAIRTFAVLERLDVDDVHRAARALPQRRQQDLAKSLRVPVVTLTESPTAASIVRHRARRMSRGAVSGLGRDLVAVCGDDTITALGDTSDDPSFEDLTGVLDPLVDTWGARVVAVLLAATADGDFPARDVCLRVLDEDPRFALDALGPVHTDDPAATPEHEEAAADDAAQEAKRDLRRQRRQEQKAKAKPPTGRPKYRKRPS